MNKIWCVPIRTCDSICAVSVSLKKQIISLIIMCGLILPKKEKKASTKNTQKAFLNSLLSVIWVWKKEGKNWFLSYFRRLSLYFFLVKVWYFKSIFKNMLPVCSIFSGLHYSLENLKDWTALSKWLKFSARLLNDCSSLTINQYAICSLQHTLSLCVNCRVLRLLVGEDDV